MNNFRVATAQLPPPPESDDRLYVVDNAVVLLDGASAFSPTDVATGTYVDTLGAQLCLRLTQDDADLRSVLAESIDATAELLNVRSGHSPSSTVAIARANGDGLDILVLGDSQAVTPTGTIRDERLSRVAAAERTEYRRRLAEGNGYDESHRRLLRALQAEQARHRNTPDGYWIAEAEPEAAMHALLSRVEATAESWVVLASDGAYRPAEHLGWDDWQPVGRMTTPELELLLRRCHDWEAGVDPNGIELPRAKRHDDKSLAVINF